MNKIKIKRATIIFIIPLILFFSIFYPSYYEIEKISGENKWKQTGKLEATAPKPISIIKNIFETSFEIKWYKFCFIDRGTETIILHYINNSEVIEISYPANTTLLLNIDNQTCSKEMIKNRFHCEEINLDKEFNFGWNFISSLTINETTAGEVIDYRLKDGGDVKIRPEKWSLLTKLILTLLSYWAILWLITRMIYYYQYGISKDNSTPPAQNTPHHTRPPVNN